MWRDAIIPGTEITLELRGELGKERHVPDIRQVPSPQIGGAGEVVGALQKVPDILHAFHVPRRYSTVEALRIGECFYHELATRGVPRIQILIEAIVLRKHERHVFYL